MTSARLGAEAATLAPPGTDAGEQARAIARATMAGLPFGEPPSVEALGRAGVGLLRSMDVVAEIVRSRPGCLVVRSSGRPPRQVAEACELVGAWLQALPELAVGVRGNVAESTCAARGGRACVHTVMWTGGRVGEATGGPAGSTDLPAARGTAEGSTPTTNGHAPPSTNGHAPVRVAANGLAPVAPGGHRAEQATPPPVSGGAADLDHTPPYGTAQVPEGPTAGGDAGGPEHDAPDGHPGQAGARGVPEVWAVSPFPTVEAPGARPQGAPAGPAAGATPTGVGGPAGEGPEVLFVRDGPTEDLGAGVGSDAVSAPPAGWTEREAAAPALVSGAPPGGAAAPVAPAPAPPGAPAVLRPTAPERLVVGRAGSRSRAFARRTRWARRRAVLLAVGLVGGLLGGYVATTHGSSGYSGTAVLVVTTTTATGATSTANGAAQLAITYAALIPDDQALLEHVAGPLGASPTQVGKALAVEAVSGTALVDIRYSASAPKTATRGANLVVRALASYSPPGRAIIPGTVSVVSEAKAAATTGSLHKYGLPLGLFLGLLVGFGAAALAERIDRRVDDVEGLADAAGCSATGEPGGLSAAELVRSLGGTAAPDACVAVVPLRAGQARRAMLLARSLAAPGPGRPAGGAGLPVEVHPPFDGVPGAFAGTGGPSVLVVAEGERAEAVSEAAGRLRLMGRDPSWAVLVAPGGARAARRRGH